MSNVHYNVPVIPQGPHNTCWLACFRMLIAFRIQVGRPVNSLARALLSPATVARFEELNRGLNPARFESMARDFGLSAMHVAGLTRPLRGNELEDPLMTHDILRTRGPFTRGGLVPGGAHAVVICGASDTPPYDIEFIDPRFTNMRHLSYADLNRGFRPDGGALFVF